MMSIANSLGFTDVECGLSSFVNFVKILQTFDETSPEFDWEAYLSCISAMPVPDAKPGIFQLPLGAQEQDLCPPLPAAVAKAVVERFAAVRGIRERLAESMGTRGKPDFALISELGPPAMRAIRELGNDLEVDRFDSGETYVLGLKLREAVSGSAIADAQLIQIGDDVRYLSESDELRAARLGVTTYALVYRLPEGSDFSRSVPSSMRKLSECRQRVQDVFVAQFPGNHAYVEFRDVRGATVLRGQPVGPTYAEKMASIRKSREQQQAT